MTLPNRFSLAPPHPSHQVGDAAGYVTKCSGEGIYFAAKSGRMAAEAIVAESQGGKKMVGEGALRVYLDKFDSKYWASYKVLDILQKVFYRCACCSAVSLPVNSCGPVSQQHGCKASFCSSRCWASCRRPSTGAQGGTGAPSACHHHAWL